MDAAVRALVLAAGKGTRMGGDRPKVLYEAGGQPLLAWVLGALSDAGANDPVVVVGFRKEEVVRALPTGVRWAEQSPQLGTGHAVGCARSLFDGYDGAVVVTYGDMPLVTAASYRRLADLRAHEGAAAVMLTVGVPPDSRFGRVRRDASGAVLGVVEWKDATPAERAIPEGNAGVYCFDARALFCALDAVKPSPVTGEWYLPEVLPIMRARGQKALAAPADDPEEALGVNTPDDLRAVEARLAGRR